MEKAYIIIAYDGTEVIDATPQAEIRLANMEYMLERKARQEKRAKKCVRRSFKAMCGL